MTNLLALCIVGAVSHGFLRHVVQTLPLWFPIAIGFRQRELAKWSALPCMIFWLVVVIFIWLFLLGWASILSGHFSTTEIAMTLVIGLASAAGLLTILRWRTSINSFAAIGTVILFEVLQLLAFRLSLTPYIATH
ncbi:MAG TPA: hypothetical protein VKV95_14020 [Terriglobia bacterium]|nr:hypothetical protein [Terriglobia bacterium]